MYLLYILIVVHKKILLKSLSVLTDNILLFRVHYPAKSRLLLAKFIEEDSKGKCLINLPYANAQWFIVMVMVLYKYNNVLFN